MRTILYVILFAALSPRMLFHIAAPKSKSITLKSVIIHAFLFGIAVYALNILARSYPILDGFADSAPSFIETIQNTMQNLVDKAKEFVGIKREEHIPEHSGSLPPPMTPEEPMKKSIQHTKKHGRVGASDKV